MKPQLSVLDFSKNVLVRIATELGSLYILLDRPWFGKVAERWGDQVAWDRQMRLWQLHNRYNAFYHVEALNMQGLPVETCLKAQQVNAGYGSLLYDTEIELIKRADEAMYNAKGLGKNQVCVFSNSRGRHAV